MTQRVSGERSRVALLAVAVVAAAVYANSLGNAFVFDDRLLIENNPVVRGEGSTADVLLAPYYAGARRSETGLYRPLTLASFALDYRLYGLRPTGYHVTNVALHVLVSLCVLALARRLGLARPAAVAGALLFAVHPIHTEAVANLAGRADLLSALFFLVALLLGARRPHRGRARRRAELASAAAFLLALCSKENAVTLVGIVVAWEYTCGRDAGRGTDWKNVARHLAPMGTALLLYLALRAVALGTGLAGPSEISHIDNPLVGAAVGERLATAVAVAVRYLALFVFPWKLSPDYSYAQIVPVAPASLTALGAFAVLAAVTVLAVWAGWRSRVAAFLAWFAVISFSITSNVVVLIGTIMAERLLYLPSVALCLAFAAVLPVAALRLGRRPVIAGALVVLVAASARTVVRNLDWRDAYTLFSRAERTSPRSVKVLNNLAAELLRRHRPEEARALLERALRIEPDYASARANLAHCLSTIGDLAGAEREVAAVLVSRPDHSLALFQLGELRLRDGRPHEAEAAFRRVLEIEPGSGEVRERIAAAIAARGALPEAIAWLEQSLELDPDSVAVANALGLLYQRAGRADDAVRSFRDAVRLEPDAVALLNNLGNALRDAGRLEASVEELERAARIDPGFAPTRYNLGLTLERAGRSDEAEQSYALAVSFEPGHGDAHRGLGRLALARQALEVAIRHLDDAIRIDAADEEAHALRAKANLALGRHDAAREDYLRVLELNPTSVAARNNLGILAAFRGDEDAARRWWEEALELAPDSREIRDNLAKLGSGARR